jgi:hypothetical protein
MAQLIVPDGGGDTPKQIEDKVRALPTNQGLNESPMWDKIDTEIASAKSASKYRDVEPYVAGKLTGNKRGN